MKFIDYDEKNVIAVGENGNVYILCNDAIAEHKVFEIDDIIDI